jgi:hypothetical protein
MDFSLLLTQEYWYFWFYAGLTALSKTDWSFVEKYSVPGKLWAIVISVAMSVFFPFLTLALATFGWEHFLLPVFKLPLPSSQQLCVGLGLLYFAKFVGAPTTKKEKA